MNKRRRIYEGKAKVLYEGPEPGTLIQHFKDDATAFNAKKHALIDGKGALNNRISEYIFVKLGEIGVMREFFLVAFLAIIKRRHVYLPLDFHTYCKLAATTCRQLVSAAQVPGKRMRGSS